MSSRDTRARTYPQSGHPISTSLTYDTVEVRWFATGALPDSVVDWFTESGAKATLETRIDAYLFCRSDDVGIKRRDGGPLEVKLLTDRSGTIHLRNGLSGRVEGWRKVVGATPPAVTARDSWVDVHKSVLTRTFHLSGDGLIENPSHELASGCDIELAAVSLGSITAWTFAAEAWGPATRRRAVFDLSLVELFAGSTAPDPINNSLHTDAGYPAWLAMVHWGEEFSTHLPSS